MKKDTLKLEDLMHEGIFSVGADMALTEAARLMAQKRISCLVVEDNGTLAGIVTERDMTRFSCERKPNGTRVWDVMSKPVLTASAAIPFHEGFRLMQQRGVRHLVVTDGKDEPSGIVSETDIRLHLEFDIFRRISRLESAMDRDSTTLPPDAKLSELSRKMMVEGRDFVVVADAGRPVGVVTERDMPRLLCDHEDPGSVALCEVMSSPVLTVSLEASVSDAVELMDRSHVRHVVVVDGSGKHAGVISQHGLLERLGIAYDVAESLRIQNELCEREEIYKSIVSQAADAIVLIDTKTRKFVEFNAAAHEGLGYSREEFSGLALDDIQESLDLTGFHRRFEASVRNGGSNFESRHRRKDGSLVDVHINSRLLDFGGKTYLSAIWHDITELKLIQGMIESEASRRKAVYDTAMDAFVTLDPTNGGVLEANSSFARMLGYEEGEIRNLYVWDWDAKWSREELLAMLEVEMEGDGPFFVETRMRRKDGRIIAVEVSSNRVAWHGKTWIFCACRDITERKQLEAKLHASERLFRNLAENSPDIVIRYDRQCRRVYVNKTFQDMTGHAELLGKTPMEGSPAENPKAFEDRIGEAFEKGIPLHCDVSGKVGGTERFVEFILVPEIACNGEVESVLAVGRDMTERRRAEEAAELAASIYQASNEAVMVTDGHNRIVNVNPAFTRITGYSLGDVLGKDPKEVLKSGKHDGRFYREMWRSILSRGGWQGEIWDRKKSGELYAAFVNISVIREEGGGIRNFMAQFLDITEKKRRDELVWNQANYDALTGLPNRSLLRDRLEQEIRKSDRSAMPFALLFIDLDRFKEINDTLGHDMGDILLREAARRVSGCVRATDTVARLGGDEFTVILPDFKGIVKLERIVESILLGLRKPFALGKENACISGSIGIAIYPDDARDIESLLKYADQAMYVSKAEGRNRFSYFTESMQRKMLAKIGLTNDLRAALIEREFRVHYQPIVDLRSGKIVKAEALLRWNHPAKGLVGPEEFIPLAEEAGLIVEIGEWVFDQVVSDVDRWRREFGHAIQAGVNKSPAQFRKDGGNGNWLQKLMDLDLPRNSIAVEITESLLLDNDPWVSERLLKFRDCGIEVAIDDFGTGFSSLSYLKKFHIDYLKIDRSFIQGLAKDKNDAALVEAIIVMAHKLGIRTIAEGVETDAQREILVSLGCDYVQGYLFYRPMAPEQFETLLESPQCAGLPA